MSDTDQHSVTEIDPVTFEVLHNGLAMVAEEMSANLVRTSYSPNIKERKDSSCAVFDASAQMVTQAENIPVHLGAMPYSVLAAIERFDESDLAPGDTIMLNSPYAGGAHLPDITVVSPVFVDEALVAYVANRAHHSDIGGIQAGSVAANTTSIYQEGLQLPPVKLYSEGKLVEDVFHILLENVRTPDERRGDLRAQQAANETGRRRLHELVEEHGLDVLRAAFATLLDYSERRMRAEIDAMPDGNYSFTDALESDGTGVTDIEIVVTVEIDSDELHVDFTGTHEQVPGPINTPFAVTASATYYALRAITDPEIPPNAGCYRPVSITAPDGTVVNARKPAAVVGGNLETSQRIVDTILGAMGSADVGPVAAASNGSMNNVTFGGVDPCDGSPYTFYETIGGGYGACRSKDGVDGVHAHMTNTRNTPVEVIELAYPLRIEHYGFRPDTGGAGRYRGGLGIRRDVRVLDHDAEFSLLAERRRLQPYGIEGGGPGGRGEDTVSLDGEELPVDGKTTQTLEPGSVVSIRTPGGGGYGRPEERDVAAIERDLREGRLTDSYVRETYPQYDGTEREHGGSE